MNSGLNRALGRLRLAVAALNLAVAFLGGTVTCTCVRLGHPVLAGGCAFLAAATLAALPSWWGKTR
jgi:hypothetical protein